MQPGIPDVAWVYAAATLLPIAVLSVAVYEAVRRWRNHRGDAR